MSEPATIPAPFRACIFCEEESASPYRTLSHAWQCRVCGYIWRENRAVVVEPVNPRRGRVDKVLFFRRRRRAGFRLSDNAATTRAWIRYWLEGLVKNPADLSWDGVRPKREGRR